MLNEINQTQKGQIHDSTYVRYVEWSNHKDSKGSVSWASFPKAVARERESDCFTCTKFLFGAMTHFCKRTVVKAAQHCKGT